MAHQQSTLLNFIIGIFSEMPLVNTVVFKDDDVIDTEKENIYPLVSLRLMPSPPPYEDRREFTVHFEVMNQRDDKKKIIPSKLMTDSNYIDSVGITDSIANNFIMEVMKNHNDHDIDIIENGVTPFEPVRKDERNMLDGVKFDVTFSMHQNAI